MTQKFKVGDKVRILDADKICSPSVELNNGDIFVITGDEGGYGYYQSKSVLNGEYLGINPEDHDYIEKVSDKPTKNQRISTLESEVAELKAEVAALKAQPSPTEIAEMFAQARLKAQLFEEAAKGASDAFKGHSKKLALTPNEQRKGIIAEAKAFVAELTAYINPGKGGYAQYHPRYGEIKFAVYMHLAKPYFVVKPDSREVTCVIKPAALDKILTKAIAKCAPDDVFNADIGKAIALGRALGLDVSKFEQAVKPTEVVVGQTFKVTSRGAVAGNVAQITSMRPSCDGIFGKAFNHTNDSGWLGSKQVAIIDDTEAQY